MRGPENQKRFFKFPVTKKEVYEKLLASLDMEGYIQSQWMLELRLRDMKFW